MSLRVWRFMGYVSVLGLMTTAAASMCVKAQCWWMNRQRHRGKKREINEVLFINEQTILCLQNHAIQNPDMPYWYKSEAPAKVLVCDNIYCINKQMDRLLHFIDNAQASIDVAMYTFSIYQLATAVVRASRRGVKVRLITDKVMAKALNEKLKNAVEILYNDGEMLMHHKFCIIDGPEQTKRIGKESILANKQNTGGILITGSLNWTKQGFRGNWENCLITSNETILQKYEQEFERLWQTFMYQTFIN